jgi:hypothetical protein
MYLNAVRDQLKDELKTIRDEGRSKDERVIVTPQGARIRVQGGREVLNPARITTSAFAPAITRRRRRRRRPRLRDELQRHLRTVTCTRAGGQRLVLVED